MGPQKQVQFSHKALQFRNALGGCLQALFLPHEPGLSFFRDANGEIAFQKDARFSEYAKSAVCNGVEQRRTTSLPDADRVRVKRKRDQDELFLDQTLQDADL